MEILTFLDAIKFILVPIVIGAAITIGIFFVLIFILFLFAEVIPVPDWVKALWNVIWISIAILLVISSMWGLGVSVLYPGLVK